MKNKHFDEWSTTYDHDVKVSNEKNIYPFAGYDQIMGIITQTICAKSMASILDVGIGTAVLSKTLYDAGYEITGTDFSDAMLKIAQQKMPDANFYVWDFTDKIPVELKTVHYDFILFTYSIHHIKDSAKVKLLRNIASLLNDDGMIIIGDISFKTNADLEKCKRLHRDIWDWEESYLSADYIAKCLGNKYEVTYQQVSYCSGVMKIKVK